MLPCDVGRDCGAGRGGVPCPAVRGPKRAEGVDDDQGRSRRADCGPGQHDQSGCGTLESVQEMLAEDGKLTLTGFGTFVAETRQERQGRNPRTGDVITIAASKVVRFRPGKMLKDALNK